MKKFLRNHVVRFLLGMLILGFGYAIASLCLADAPLINDGTSEFLTHVFAINLVIIGFGLLLSTICRE
ncbi:MAG: hypothetical protein WCT49_05015 [Candidatus Paceibacterota bacterium]|nr:hypothetical protein [Candidatus Paceibacterota bacterium]